MPVAYTKIDMDEVRPILKSRGYGFHSDRKYPLTLNKPSSDPKMRSKTTGTPRMEQLKPISRAELDAILTKAQNAEEAARAQARGESQPPDKKPAAGKPKPPDKPAKKPDKKPDTGEAQKAFDNILAFADGLKRAGTGSMNGRRVA